MQFPYFYTDEMIKISKENNKKTRELLNVPYGYHMHHIDMNMRWNDPYRYILWLPEDLEIMTREEHRAVHAAWAGSFNRGKIRTQEAKELISLQTKEAMWRPEVRSKLLDACARPVRCIETKEEFETIADANKKYKGHIREVCAGTRKTAAGLHWEYIKKPN